ncbi:MAG: hypothetical protein LUG16_00960 [Candidatus Gastranaerophilales bacterium]|nr:hypothetical protein [Candidatus Gastranaerophilales bacterium]
MLKKLFLLNFMFFSCIIPVFAYSQNQLDDIEYSKYGQIYSNDSLSSRLNRLETDLLGMTQSGSIDSRINMLMNMSENAHNPGAIYSYNNYPVKKSTIKSFFDSVSDTFSGGTMTGFTPSLHDNTFYSGGLYGNGFMDYLNNSSRYCPYGNGYNSVYNTYQRNYANRFLNNSYNNGISKYYNDRYRSRRLNRYPDKISSRLNHIGRAYPPQTRNSIYWNRPTSYSSGSSVHIIND